MQIETQLRERKNITSRFVVRINYGEHGDVKKAFPGVTAAALLRPIETLCLRKNNPDDGRRKVTTPTLFDVSLLFASTEANQLTMLLEKDSFSEIAIGKALKSALSILVNPPAQFLNFSTGTSIVPI